MRRLTYTDAARRDLFGIYDFIARESSSPAIARRFVDLLRRQCLKLASLPALMGRLRSELRPDIRSFAFRGYVIFMRYREDRLEIVNIIEGHRDIVAYFGEE